MTIPVRRLAILSALVPLTLAQTTLYNGIVLPGGFPQQRSPTQAYQLPSYITNPPPVIVINTGRQLFVDDFLIEQTTLTRVPHRPVLYGGNPVLTTGSGWDNNTLAFPYSDGVWYDPDSKLFKMWYDGGNGNNIAYAYSSDGKNWTKPAIPDAAVPGTNLVLSNGGGRDSDTVWRDALDPNPARRYKAFALYNVPQFNVYLSGDGIHWSAPVANNMNSLSDRTTVFYNPFRNVWVESARQIVTLPGAASRGSYDARARFYAESRDLVNWTNPAGVYWTGPDEQDPPYAGPGGAYPELYNLDAVAYESVLVGLFSWFHPGPGYKPSYNAGPNLVELGVGFSRDGFGWVRPTRGFAGNAFIPASNIDGTWNCCNTQSVGGGFLVVGDELWFYFSARSGRKPATVNGSTGLATLRRDGFYSMDAGGSEGVLTTRPVSFSGSHLFVNAAAASGRLQAEVLDTNGNVIAPFSRANSSVISSDTTRSEISWAGASDLSSLANRPVKIRFYLTSGSLYSFWVTPSATGASYGYVAAGGPGFIGAIDDVGGSAGRGSAPPPSSGDTTPPEVSVSSPVGGATVSGTVTLSANASDNRGVAGVQFRIDGGNAGPEIQAAPYQYGWNTAAWPNGNHTITAIARDASGNTAASPGVTVNVSNGSRSGGADSVAPAVSITSPGNGATVAGIVAITAAASDNVGVTGVFFRVDGANTTGIIAAPPFRYDWNSSLWSNGSHTITALAMDAAGNMGSASIAVNSSNGGPVGSSTPPPSGPDATPPAVSITSPANGAAVTGTVTISATASDNVGVAGVVFRIDGANVAPQILSPPYQYTWNSSLWWVGSHTITAIATDAAGNTSSSTISVTTGSGGTGSPSGNASIPANPAGFWSFDTADTSGNSFLDRSGNGGDATGYAIGAASGRVGQAAHFNGTNSYATVSKSSQLQLLSDLTLSAWIRTANSGQYEAIMGCFDATGMESSYLLRVTGSGALSVLIGGANIRSGYGFNAVDSRPLNDGAWHHVAAVLRLGTGVTFYVDGAAGSSAAADIRSGATLAPFAFGVTNWTPYGTYFSGDMDQIRVYNRALAPAEIQALAQER